MPFYRCSGGGGKEPQKLGTISTNYGSGTFNVSTVLSNYASLSIEDFFLDPISVGISFLGGRHNDGQWHSSAANVSKTYNASTGVITVGGGATVGGGDNTGWITRFDVYYIK